MRFKINQWAALAGGDAVYVGRVKKISIEEKGTSVFVVFGPGDSWVKLNDNELLPAAIHIINPAVAGVPGEEV